MCVEVIFLFFIHYYFIVGSFLSLCGPVANALRPVTVRIPVVENPCVRQHVLLRWEITLQAFSSDDETPGAGLTNPALLLRATVLGLRLKT